MNKEKQQVFERVRVENDELREKIGNLLRMQYDTMTAYANILEKRLALYEEESKTTDFN